MFILGEPMKPATNGAGRIVVECHRRSDLLDSSAVQNDDLVGHGHRLDLVVGDVDHRRAELGVELGRVRCASATRSDASRLDSGSSNRKTLGLRMMARPIATRWRWPPDSAFGLRSSRCESCRMSAVCLTLLGDLRLGTLGERQAEADVFCNGQMRVERIGLEDHGDTALGRFGIGNVLARR